MVTSIKKFIQEVLDERGISSRNLGSVNTPLPAYVPNEEALPVRFIVKTLNAKVRETVEQLLRTELDTFARDIHQLFPDSKGVPSLESYLLVKLEVFRGHVGARGYDIAYRLRDMPGVANVWYEGIRARVIPTRMFGGGSTGNPPKNRNWSNEAVRLPQAQQIPGFKPGTGVVIGHPDTGWAQHPELDMAALDLKRQWNTLTNTSNAIDPQKFILFNGHGTATGSVLISGPSGEINGIAPDASLLPIRCVESVVLILDVEVAKAVWYASQQNVHVISISLGGLPMPHLQDVIRYAVNEKNIIIAASAGHYEPIVAYPAAYPECIAVTGTTPTDRPWKESAWGPKICVSAPAHFVWVADFDENRQPLPTKAGDGTSFATPHVAAAAALWLAFHGRQAVLGRYSGAVPLQEVFRMLLKRTARNPGVFQMPGTPDDVDPSVGYKWDVSRYGAGIVDIEALLRAPLPMPNEVPVPSWRSLDWLDVLEQLLHKEDVRFVRSSMEKILSTTGESVDDCLQIFGAELVHLILNDMSVLAEFRSITRTIAAQSELSSSLEGSPPGRRGVFSQGSEVSMALKSRLGYSV